MSQEDDGRELASADTIRLYLDEIRSISLLTAEEERELARRIERGEAAGAELERLRIEGRRQRLEAELLRLRRRL